MTPETIAELLKLPEACWKPDAMMVKQHDEIGWAFYEGCLAERAYMRDTDAATLIAHKMAEWLHKHGLIMSSFRPDSGWVTSGPNHAPMFTPKDGDHTDLTPLIDAVKWVLEQEKK